MLGDPFRKVATFRTIVILFVAMISGCMVHAGDAVFV